MEKCRIKIRGCVELKNPPWIQLDKRKEAVKLVAMFALIGCVPFRKGEMKKMQELIDEYNITTKDLEDYLNYKKIKVMEKKQTHREPTLYIVGNPERKDEIRHIIEDEWGGDNKDDYKFDNELNVYYISSHGIVIYDNINSRIHKDALKNGWMKEYKLPEKPKFKPFDKVVVRSAEGCIWEAGFYSHYSDSYHHVLTNSFGYEYCLPFNEQTEKLIGTNN